MNRLDFDGLAEKVRNWGRWGADDNRGTLNHIGPDSLKRGLAASHQGKLFSLGMRFDRNGHQLAEYGRLNPQLYMTAIDQALNPERPFSRFNDDAIHMSLQAATQWDALSHVHYEGELYNGCKVCDVLSPSGAKRLGVEHLASPGIMSRAIFLDIARMHGVDLLPGAYGIGPDELDRALDHFGVETAPGDILLVRTGAMRRFTIDGDRQAFASTHPGLTPACAEWLHDRSLAAVASDNLAVESIPLETLMDDVPLPMHMLCLRDMGMPLGELFDLEALSVDCALDGQYQFLLSAPPLAFTGAVGSPVNPLVLK